MVGDGWEVGWVFIFDKGVVGKGLEERVEVRGCYISVLTFVFKCFLGPMYNRYNTLYE